MFCRKCGNQIPDDSEFCMKCGTKVLPEFNPVTQLRCSNCSEEIHSASIRFCPKCGATVKPVHEEPEKHADKPVKTFSEADKKKLDELHKDLEEAKKKQEQESNNVLLSFYSTDSLRPVCEEIKKIDNNDFAANDSLVSSYCQRLNRNDFRDGFNKAIECAKLALEACPEQNRTVLAEGYYKKLAEKITKIFARLENEYYSTSDRSLFGVSDRSRYENENAKRDLEVFRSLCELSRIPYLSKNFIVEWTATIITIYKGVGTYMHVVRAKMRFTSYDTYCKEELRKNYPQYY